MTATDTPTLVDFLRARYDEDEALAQKATGSEWTAELHRHRKTGEIVNAEVHPPCECEGDGSGGCAPRDALHIARHDPATVLADIEAKREILDEYEAAHAEWKADQPMPLIAARFATLHRVVELLARQFADHPEYREEWRA